VNTVSATLPGGVTDPQPGNNSATDVNLVGAGSLPPTLQIDRAGSQLVLSWGTSCLTSDADYAIYEGNLGDFSSHVPFACTTGGVFSLPLTAQSESAYYLVVPRNAFSEGSYGLTGTGVERPASTTACRPHAVGTCL